MKGVSQGWSLEKGLVASSFGECDKMHSEVDKLKVKTTESKEQANLTKGTMQ